MLETGFASVVYIPNSFSPGITEGLNDEFGPQGLYIEDYSMKIFNRWGQRLYSTNNGARWNGRFEGGLIASGVYAYSIVVTGKDGEQKEFQGTVTVIR